MIIQKGIPALLILLALTGCASTTSTNKNYSSNRANQCLIEYKVSYSQNDVPNWDQPPEGFCTEKDEFAVPAATSVLPLAFKTDEKNKDIIRQADSWFYVIWNCYSTCDKENRIKKKPSSKK